MICFPLKFKPIYIDNKELMRIGSIYDGGYVVPYKAIIETSKLISFGINDNWDFEKDFSKISLANIIAYDHSIDSNFWKKRFKNDSIIDVKIDQAKENCRKSGLDEKTIKHFRVHARFYLSPFFG